jgi:hypothetical protein
LEHDELFHDQRLNEASCPLCSSALRVVEPKRGGWGEYGFFQCDACGATVEICNMLDKPMTFEMFRRQMDEEMYFSLKSWIKEKSFFPLMPRADGSVPVVKVRPDKVRCDSCSGSFIPRSNATSEMQTRFCPDCRKNGNAANVVADEKAAVKRSKAAKKAAETRKRNASKKEKK